VSASGFDAGHDSSPPRRSDNGVQKNFGITGHVECTAGWHGLLHLRTDAVFAGLNPTAANLLHHAVEMTLKGTLAKKGLDLKALERLKHDLPKIWQGFTAQYGIDGRAFARIIAELQKFETIRYPDKIVREDSNPRSLEGSRAPRQDRLYGSPK
jgi:hypothetical protein